jgi:RNA polymerase sigma-70 factor (sigma-E family)
MHWLRAPAAKREFEQFVSDGADHLLRTAYMMTNDLAEAEDLVQETLLRVARRWHKVHTMAHPAAYARRILVNLVIDHAGQRALRNRELAMHESTFGSGPADPRAEGELQAVDSYTVLLAALASLPARQRAVIVLRYWHDLPEAEVAAVLSCSIGTVKSTASRGLSKLRELIGAAELEPCPASHDTTASLKETTP